MQTTTKFKNYSTTLLTDFRNEPVLRALAAIAVVGLVVASIGLTAIGRTRPAAAAATPLPVIIIATPTPQARPQPTATPAPAPLRELEDGTIVAWDGQRWYVVRDAPQLDQGVAADAPPTAAPEVYQTSASDPQDAPVATPEEQPGTTHERENALNDLGPGGSGKLPAIDFGQAAPAADQSDAERWCEAAGSMCKQEGP